MSPSEYDFLLIGQGLAGSILAYTLVTAGYKVLVIDNNLTGSSSKVAAGIINPVTGHRLNLTKRFYEFFPIAEQCYTNLNRQFNKAIYQRIKQTRLIKNQGQYENLQKRLNEKEYYPLLEINTNNMFPNTCFGCINVSHSAVVNTKVLLNEIREWLRQQQSYCSAIFDYSALKIKDKGNGVHYRAVRASKIIFCEGYQAITNPWLDHLPFKLAKGDILTVKTDKTIPGKATLGKTTPGAILNWGNWLVGNGETNKLGSNFEWNTTSPDPTPGIELSLVTSLQNHTGLQATVIAHEAGIRPGTIQRKPFIGPLSELSNSYCFNGFGSKGCLLIPFYAHLLTDHFTHNTVLPEELTQWL